MAGRRAQLIIPLVLVIIYMIALVTYPAILNWISLVLIVVCLGMALLFIFQNHWHALALGRISRTKFACAVLVDMLCLFLTIAATSYLGRLAGTWLGVSFGVLALSGVEGWVGVIVGLGTAFVVSWAAWRAWGRVRRSLAE